MIIYLYDKYTKVNKNTSETTKVRYFIHCTSFSNHYNLLNTEQNSVNVVSLENHGQVEH